MVCHRTYLVKQEAAANGHLPNPTEHTSSTRLSVEAETGQLARPSYSPGMHLEPTCGCLGLGLDASLWGTALSTLPSGT